MIVANSKSSTKKNELENLEGNVTNGGAENSFSAQIEIERGLKIENHENGDGIEKNDDFDAGIARKQIEEMEQPNDLAEKSSAGGSTVKRDDENLQSSVKINQIDRNIGSVAKQIAALQDAQAQIDRLIVLATENDPLTAVKVARHLDNNYVLDKLHDGLVEDKIRTILINKGILKE